MPTAAKRAAPRSPKLVPTREGEALLIDAGSVGINLEDGHDPRARRFGGLEIAVNQLDMGVDDTEPIMGRAPEHVARAGRLRIQELAQNHPPGS